MVPLKRGEIEAGLERKGFRRRESDHSHFIYYTEEGKQTSVWTKTSHGRRNVDIRAALLGRMARQCRLSHQQFRDLIECSLSRRQFEETLVSKGVFQHDDLAVEGGDLAKPDKRRL